jgi:membrane protein DedA with SNARE-associated domain
MSGLSSLLLTGLISYGASAFALAVLLSQIGFPLPTTLLVVVAGAFSREGILNVVLAGGLGLAGAVLGDSLTFALGRFARGWVQRRFGASRAWQSAQQTFDKWGGLAIYTTRFMVGVGAFAQPVSLIAGGNGYSYYRYLLYSIAGEATWIGIYGGLGFIFGSQWELISDFITSFGGLLFGLFTLGVGVYFFLRWRRRVVRHHKVNLVGRVEAPGELPCG